MKDKQMSSLQKDINRLKKSIVALQNINLLRKKQITCFHNLIKELINKEIITKEEVNKFIKKKSEIKNYEL